MGLGMSLLGKGLPSGKMLSLVTDKLFEQFIEKPPETFEDFHIAILNIFNSFNSALPGRHYDVPAREDVEACFKEWKDATDAEKEEVFKKLMTMKVNTSRLDNSTMVVGLVTPPAAMAVKRAGENVPQIRVIKAIPDVILVPTATLLALVSVKLTKRMSIRKHIA